MIHLLNKKDYGMNIDCKNSDEYIRLFTMYGFNISDMRISDLTIEVGGEDEIPPEIGVLVAIDRLEPREKEEILDFGIKKTSSWREPIDGLKELYCIKSARKQELKADKEVILSSMLRSMQRDRIYDLERSDT